MPVCPRELSSALRQEAVEELFPAARQKSGDLSRCGVPQDATRCHKMPRKDWNKAAERMKEGAKTPELKEPCSLVVQVVQCRTVWFSVHWNA